MKVRVWDLPTRLFHWALVLTLVGLVVTGNVGGNWMNWHLILGHVALALLVFRLAWGLVGGHWSRFASFVYAPASLWAYLRGTGPRAHTVGHSPLGALSVFAMLAILMVQVSTGLMADDEIAFFGPLSTIVPLDWVTVASQYHKGWGKLLVMLTVVLHLLAIAYYSFIRRQGLVGPMLHGDKTLDFEAPASADGWRQRVLALVLVGACALLAWWVHGLGAPMF